MRFGLLFAVIAFSGAARAGVKQPRGEVMPQAVNKAELDVICSRGFPDGRTKAQRAGSCDPNFPDYTPQ